MTRPRKIIYDLWAGMVKRCTDKNHVSYKYYGAKGIKVCDEWVNDIEKFISDMGERPDGMTYGLVIFKHRELEDERVDKRKR